MCLTGEVIGHVHHSPIMIRTSRTGAWKKSVLNRATAGVSRMDLSSRPFHAMALGQLVRLPIHDNFDARRPSGGPR